jgi:hypothetical protein
MIYDQASTSPFPSHLVSRRFETTYSLCCARRSRKTLIALLIAEVWRLEGKRAVILSANKTLAQQMKREAGLLNIKAALMEGSRSSILSVSELFVNFRGKSL